MAHFSLAVAIHRSNGNNHRTGGDPDDSDPILSRGNGPGDVRAVTVIIAPWFGEAAAFVRDEVVCEGGVEVQFVVVFDDARVDYEDAFVS